MKRIVPAAILLLLMTAMCLGASFPLSVLVRGGTGMAVPVNTSVPTVSGTPVVGNTLTASTGSWTNSPTSYTYQWEYYDTTANISGATSSTYVPVSGDTGHTLAVFVKASNSGGTSAAAYSTATAAVTNPVPTNSSVPVVSGSPVVGSTLTATNGTWTNSPTSYAYQWERYDTSANISGATASTYVPVTGDIGHTLAVAVTASNSGGASSPAFSAATSAVTSGSSNVAFTALHTYYMAASGGSDSYDGTEAVHTTGSTGPWATPNHALHCGDVIIAAAGTYNGNMSNWGTVSSCPSTTGGIDGSGGVYFAVLLCGGSDLSPSNGCYINCATGTCGGNPGSGMSIPANYWAVEGWTINGNGSAYGSGTMPFGFSASASASSTTITHHIAFINDIAYNSDSAFGTVTVSGADTGDVNGSDYVAFVGDIAQNGAGNRCDAAMDVYQPATYDTNSGAHVIFYGNFSYANANTACRTVSDTESYMFDTWDNSRYVQLGVISNNIGFGSDRMCIQVYGFSGTVAENLKIYNNTCFRDNLYLESDWMNGEINFNVAAGSVEWIVSVTNNIAYQPLSTPLAGSGYAAAFVYFPAFGFSGTMTNGGSATQNWWLASPSIGCRRTQCDSTNSEQMQTSGLLGTDTYTNPAFTNTTDLLANQVGVPNCAGFINATACMGWNANTSTLTTPSIISDLVPTASGVSGKGYQLPSTSCSNTGVAADYPAWLKGIVYLHWNGSSLTENSDLVTKPCNL